MINLYAKDFTPILWQSLSGPVLNLKQSKDIGTDTFGKFIEQVKDSGVDQIGYYEDNCVYFVDDKGLFEILLYDIDKTIFYINSIEYIKKQKKCGYHDKIYLNGELFIEYSQKGLRFNDKDMTFKF